MSEGRSFAVLAGFLCVETLGNQQIWYILNCLSTFDRFMSSLFHWQICIISQYMFLCHTILFI